MFLLHWAHPPIPVLSMTLGSKDVSHGVAMDKLWLKPSILKPYWLGHDLKLVHSKPPLLSLWPEEIRQPPRGLSYVSLIVSMALLDFLRLVVFSSVECSHALRVASRSS